MENFSLFYDGFTCKTKIYPDGKTSTTYCSRPIFQYKKEKCSDAESNSDAVLEELERLEELNQEKKDKKDKKEKKDEKKESSLSLTSRDDSLKRAHDAIFDIVYCNSWDYFITITYNDEKVNSYNVKDVIKKTRVWLNDRVRRNGLKYILVPELHKSGRIHCHALFNDALEMVDSGVKSYAGLKKPIKDASAQKYGYNIEDGKTVYNISDWKYGFSTAIEVYGKQSNLAWYITKYITKDVKKIFGKFYWSSKNIVRSPEIYLSNWSNWDSIQSVEYTVKNTSISYKYETDIFIDDMVLL